MRFVVSVCVYKVRNCASWCVIRRRSVCVCMCGHGEVRSECVCVKCATVLAGALFVEGACVCVCVDAQTVLAGALFIDVRMRSTYLTFYHFPNYSVSSIIAVSPPSFLGGPYR